TQKFLGAGGGRGGGQRPFAAGPPLWALLAFFVSFCVFRGYLPYLLWKLPMVIWRSSSSLNSYCTAWALLPFISPAASRSQRSRLCGRSSRRYMGSLLTSGAALTRLTPMVSFSAWGRRSQTCTLTRSAL